MKKEGVRRTEETCYSLILWVEVESLKHKTTSRETRNNKVELLPFTSKWMQLKDMVLRKKGPTQKDEYCIFSLIEVTKFKSKNKIRNKMKQKRNSRVYQNRSKEGLVKLCVISLSNQWPRMFYDYSFNDP